VIVPEQMDAAADLINTDTSLGVALPTRLVSVCQAFLVATASLQVLFIHPRVSAVTILYFFNLVLSFFLSVPLLYPHSMLISMMLTTMFPFPAETNTHHIVMPPSSYPKTAPLIHLRRN